MGLRMGLRMFAASSIDLIPSLIRPRLRLRRRPCRPSLHRFVNPSRYIGPDMGPYMGSDMVSR